jgi:hypothetical protein
MPEVQRADADVQLVLQQPLEGSSSGAPEVTAQFMGQAPGTAAGGPSNSLSGMGGGLKSGAASMAQVPKRNGVDAVLPAAQAYGQFSAQVPLCSCLAFQQWLWNHARLHLFRLWYYR